MVIKAHVPEHVKKIGPRERVKGFSNIQLRRNSITDIQEVAFDITLLGENTLGMRYDFLKVRCEPISQSLADNFGQSA